MARTNKVGIDYFSFDIDFFNDDKIQLIEAEFGIKGSIIAIRLLCKIYNEGYFYGWGEDQCLLFAKNSGSEFTPELIQNIVDGLIRRSFFDANCYEKYQILTSTGIQRRYLDATARYKEVKLIEEYLLIEVPNRNNINIIPLNVGINSINVDINPQRKGKEIEIESKGEETDLSSNKIKESIDKFFSEENKHLIPVVKEFLEYRKERGDKTYKPMGLKKLITQLVNLSGNDLSTAKKITETSMANNWAGLFELKNNKNGTEKHPANAVIGDDLYKDQLSKF